jgi:hypothetical protein
MNSTFDRSIFPLLEAARMAFIMSASDFPIQMKA